MYSRETINRDRTVDLTKPEDCNRVFEKVWARYFDASALQQAQDARNGTQYNFLLRLKDFATVVEAHEAKRDGDIGRLIWMWKRWSLMAQGLPGLSHYSRHLPRMVLLLEQDLPAPLARAIKHSMLIPSNQRAGHWLATDEYLEVHNCWLKHIYNNTVSVYDLFALDVTL